MITNISQAALLGALSGTVGQPASVITSTVTSILALSAQQSTLFGTYIAGLSLPTDWSNTLVAIGAVLPTDYTNMLPIAASKTPLDIAAYSDNLIYLTAAQQDYVGNFMEALNPISLVISGVLLQPIAQSDFVRRQIELFPRGWASPAALSQGGNLYNLFNALAAHLNIVSNLICTTQQTFSIATASGPALDIAISDFFGTTLPRLSGETDLHYRGRAYGLLFTPKITRPALQKALNAIAPTRLIEPWDPNDTGVWDYLSFWDWDLATNPWRWTDASLRYQGFADVTLSSSSSSSIVGPYTFYEGVGWGGTNAFGPLVNGAGQTGMALNVKGLSPNVPNVFNAGDQLLLPGGQIVQVVAATSSNGSGQATIALTTAIITSPADGAQLTAAPYNALAFYDNTSYYADIGGIVANSRQTVYNTILTTKAEGTMVWVKFL